MRHYPIRVLMLISLTMLVVYPAAGDPLTGTLTPITIINDSVHHWEPSISGDYIVWSDDRTGDRNIYLYNIATGGEDQITSGDVYESFPAISDRYIVWQDDRFDLSAGNGLDIVLYNLDTGTTLRIANETGDQTNPAIDGDLVVWEDRRNDINSDIYLFSISGDTEVQVSTAEGDQLSPRVSDNTVVWENSTYYPPKVAVYEYSGNQTPYQPVFFGMDEEQYTPAISTNRLVWSDNHIDLFYYRLFMMDLSTGEISEITPDENDHYFPDIDGTRIVWNEYDDIYLNDTAVSESETRITFTDGMTSKENLRISGDRIVWRDSGDPDAIYMFTIGSEETCPDADFTITPSQSGAVPFTVSFNDTSTSPPTNPIAHWNWSFGDGNFSSDQNPVWTYDSSGNFDVVLIVDNPLCRNATEISPGYRITAGAAPVAEIDASTLSGMVPLTITFTDTSAAATSWNWSFDDGTYADTNPATHTYTSGGTYTVRLEDANEFGISEATAVIHALTGADEDASTAIDGIIVVDRFGGQFLIYNGTTLPGYSLPTASILISPPLTGYGWQNITFRSGDGIGFHNFGNETIMGNLSGVVLSSNEMQPAGFSAQTGSDVSVFYMLNLTAYPVNGTINTRIWEGVLAPDLVLFRYIGHQSGFSHVLGTAYTISHSLTGFSPGGPATLYVSVNSTWVADHEGRNHTYLMRIGDDRYGQVLPTEFLYRDPATNLDYFTAGSPRGLSTFGLTQLSGSGNPFQLITLSVTSHVNPPVAYSDPSASADSDFPYGVAATTVITTVPATTPATPLTTAQAEPGTGAKVYTNPNGVVSQATRLTSPDGRATVFIREGIVAKDANGRPLTEITLKALPPGSIPPLSSGSAFTFAGMAYEIGPDGATFSPPFSLTFTLQEAQQGQEYTVKSFDRKSGTWQDLPTTFDADTGIVTVEVSHLCCFALFSEPLPLPAAPTATLLSAPSAPQVKAQPPATAVDIFTNIISRAAGFVAENILIVVGAIVVVIAGYLVKRGRFPGSGW